MVLAASAPCDYHWGFPGDQRPPVSYASCDLHGMGVTAGRWLLVSDGRRVREQDSQVGIPVDIHGYPHASNVVRRSAYRIVVGAGMLRLGNCWLDSQTHLPASRKGDGACFQYHGARRSGLHDMDTGPEHGRYGARNLADWSRRKYSWRTLHANGSRIFPNLYCQRVSSIIRTLSSPKAGSPNQSRELPPAPSSFRA